GQPAPPQEDPPGELASAPEAIPEPKPEISRLQQEAEPAQPTPPESGPMQETAPPVVNALRRARRPQVPETPEPEEPVEPEEAAEQKQQDDVRLEEYSWNSFWKRARELGL